MPYAAEILESRILLSSTSAIVSDGFDSSSLDVGVWQFIDPQGDSLATVEGGWLKISVPGGTSHDVWTGGNQAARVIQNVQNADFLAEIKLDAVPSANAQLAGILVEAGTDEYLRFDFTYNSGGLQVFAATFSSGQPTVQYSQAIAAAGSLRLRVQRTGDVWTQHYSYDGASWIAAASFTHAVAVSQVGIFAGNAGANPQYTAEIDYFLAAAPPSLAVRIDPLLTNDPTPRLSGTVADPQATVHVTVNGEQLTATNHGNGTWEIHDNVLAALADGAYDVQAVAQSTAGQTARDATLNELVVDTVAPAVTINQLATADPRPSLSGTVSESGATVEITLDGVSYTAVTTGTTWRLDGESLVAPLADGTYEVVARATDAAGNEGFDTSTAELTVDSSLPLVTVDPLVTNDTRPALSGTVNDPAASVEVTVAGVAYQGQNLGDGMWQLPNDAIQVELAEGAYDVVVRATGAAGVGLDSSFDELKIDVTPPVVTFATLVTDSSSPALTGTVDEPGAAVAVTIDGASYAAVNAGDGTWSLAAGTIAPLALGSYSVAVAATDAAGNQGLSEAASVHVVEDAEAPFVDIWYGDVQSFGNLGNPQSWVNVLGNIIAKHGLASLTYSVNGGPSHALSVGPDKRRLARPGDFNVEIDRATLLEGANTVTITAVDQDGRRTDRTITVSYTTAAPLPDVLTIDWQTVSRIDEVGQVVDGKWRLTADGVRPVETGYDRLIALGDSSMGSFEVEVPVVVHSWDTSQYSLVGFGMRWQGHAALDDSQPHWQWWPLGGFATYETRPSSGTELAMYGYETSSARTIDSESPYFLAHGVPYVFKLRVVSESGQTPTYSMKIWEQGTAEPVAWTLSGPGTLGEPPTGSFLLAAHHADVTFGDVTIRQIADETAPVLTDVQAAPTANTITVTGNTNESAQLTVLYGLTDQYELGSVTTTSFQTSHQVLLEGLDPDTDYHLRILATDAAGNQSTPHDLLARTEPPDLTAPVISNLELLTLSEQIRVRGHTDEPAKFSVSYGLTDAYELGTVSETASVTSHEVMLTGLQPETTYHIRVVATDTSGNASPGETFVVTTPAPDVDPPVIESVQTAAGVSEINLSVMLNEHAQVEVKYGLTADYELGSQQGPPLELNHNLTLSGLQPETTYYLRVVATDPSGNVSAPHDLTVTTEPLRLPVSDHFNGALDTNLWTLVDPLGDATLEATGNHVRLGVPGGTAHDMWTNGINAPRLIQAVSDVDFEVDVAFRLPPEGSIAMNGLFVDAGPANLLRFDFYRSGGKIKIFAASFTDGQPTTRANATISVPLDQPLIMRVNRTGDVWTQWYSSDGQNWTMATQFVHKAIVQGVGISSGNAGSPPPAHTAVIDYFFNTASPVADTALPALETVSVTEEINALRVNLATDEVTIVEVHYGTTTAYELGSVLAADPALTHEVTLADLEQGTTYYLRIVARDAAGHQTAQDLTATTAVPDTVPPELSAVTSTVSHDSIRLTFSTTESAVGEVHYGLTPDYELGSQQGPLELTHDLTLSGLQPETTYYLRVVATDPSGNVSAPQDLTVTTQPLRLPVSDHFNGALDTNLWTLVDPLGDATLDATANHVRLGVPGGTAHDIWTSGINAPRLMQVVSDVDLEVEVAFQRPPEGSIAMNGLFVDAGPGNLLRFDFYNSAGSVKIFAASFTDGQPTTQVNKTISVPLDQPLIMRVNRTGDVWTQWYSSDGQNWTLATQFVHRAIVQGVGISSGNAGSSPPAYTAVADYFFNTASPVSDTAPPNISGVESSAGETTIQLTGDTDESSIWHVQYGLTPDYELGTIVESAAGTTHIVSLEGLDPGRTYYIRIVAVDAVGNVSAPYDLTVPTSQQVEPAFVSDEFESDGLDTSVWTFVDPTGDGSVDVSGGTLNIWVAGRSDHDIWSSGINAPRVMQAAKDVDFAAEAKFDNVPTGEYATTGILVEGAEHTFLRFEFYSDDSGIHVFAAIIQNETATILYDETIASPGSSLYMRVTRTGDSWQQQYSTDGVNWQTGASFRASLGVLAIGLYAGNAGGSLAPEYTTSVDYFRLV